jgi:hypothetical protein
MPSFTPLKKFEVSYRNKSGNMTIKTAEATGADYGSVKSQFELRGYQVISVVYKGLAGGSARTD